MTDQLDLDAIRARYQRALDAKPSKGDYTPAGIDAITDSVCDMPDLLRELERLERWKAEALGVPSIRTVLKKHTERDMLDPIHTQPPQARQIATQSYRRHSSGQERTIK